MAHVAQQQFIQVIAKEMRPFFEGCRVLEIGSLDINGSIREHFRNCEYTGIDVAPGKGVDIVCEGQSFDAPDGAFDHVISCEAMEHNPHWAETFRNMVRLCKPGGLVVMTCATIGRREHGTERTTPSDSPLTVGLGWNYYKNLSERHFRRTLDISSVFSRHEFWVNWRSFDLYFCGIKAGGDDTTVPIWDQMVKSVRLHINETNTGKVCAYRAFVARALGDGWFDMMRELGRNIQYLHN